MLELLVPTLSIKGGESPANTESFAVYRTCVVNKPKGDETMMNFLNSLYVQLITSINSLKSEKGQGLVEYALILVLVAIVVIGALTLLGTKTSTVFSNVGSHLGS
jgi:pilus assembly protein Flp/PilA